MSGARVGTAARRAWGPGAALALLLSLATAWAQVALDVPDEGLPAGLRAPTSPLFGNVATYDLVAVRWSAPEAWPAWLEIELGAVDTGGAGPLGLRQPIVEVYVDDASGGATALLPGSGLRMPDGDGWRYAARVTGDGAWWWRVDPVTERWSTPEPLAAAVDGRTVRLAWPLPWPEDVRVYAISGVHDPFASDGWRPFSASPSPWAFASDEPSGPPIVDLLPGDADAWLRARETGALRRPTVPGPALDGRSARWWWLMAAGLATAVAGLWWRSRPGVAPGGSDAAAAAAPEAAGPGDAAGASEDAAASPPDAAPDAHHAVLADAAEHDAAPDLIDDDEVAAGGAQDGPGQPAASDAADDEPTASADGTADASRSTAPPSPAKRSANRS